MWKKCRLLLLALIRDPLPLNQISSTPFFRPFSLRKSTQFNIYHFRPRWDTEVEQKKKETFGCLASLVVCSSRTPGDGTINISKCQGSVAFEGAQK